MVHIDHAFMALTGDIIGHVACGAHPGLVEDAGFSPSWYVSPFRVTVLELMRCQAQAHDQDGVGGTLVPVLHLSEQVPRALQLSGFL